MPSSVSALPSQLALVGSIVIYPSIFYLLTPRGITPSRFAKNREAISAFHCALMTVLTLVVLQRRQRDWVPPTSDESRGSRARGAGGAENETPHSIISARSGFGNTIIALETGYLLQDTIVLMLGARLRSRRTSEKGLMKELNLRVLVWHHGGIASALGLFQWYVGQGKEKGVLIILMLMLMNTSTPIGSLLWYLINFQPSRRRAITAANALYLATYAVCRVYLIHWILSIYGSHTGHSAVQTFWRKLRLPCQIGTGAIGLANSIWLIMAVRKSVARYGVRAGARNGL